MNFTFLHTSNRFIMFFFINTKKVSSDISDLLHLINDNLTYQATKIERLVVASLEGNCLSPISALCKIDGQDAELKIRVSNQAGTDVNDTLIGGSGNDTWVVATTAAASFGV